MDDRFRDADGKNPFADGVPDTQGSANPFAASDVAERPYRPGDFQEQFADRSSLISWFGGIGLAVAILGLFVTAFCVVASSSLFAAVMYCLPIQCVSLAVAIPAWMMGRADLMAIHAGAMSGDQRQRVRRGWAMGVAAIAVVVLPLLAVAVWGMAGLFE